MLDKITTDPMVQQKMEIAIPQQKEYTYKGSIRLKKGLKLYAYNIEEMSVDEVPLKREIVSLDKNGVLEKRLKAMHNPKCVYIQALNLDNAKRKAKQIQSYIHDKAKKRE